MFGGTDQFANVPRTKQNCPNKDCDGREAWYSQAQTRSADEGSTNTYTVSGWIWVGCEIWTLMTTVCEM